MNIINRIPVCQHVSKEAISQELIKKIQEIEEATGVDYIFTSGYRCVMCNTAAKGSKNSAHLRGLAVDISCNYSRSRWELITKASLLGIRRIGIAKTFVHLDIDISLPQDVMWLY